MSTTAFGDDALGLFNDVAIGVTARLRSRLRERPGTSVDGSAPVAAETAV
jgi:hypothetical protein